ncbi:MAG: hypothetical protein AB7G15_04945 [Alphaproteobacteria bacterium]
MARHAESFIVPLDYEKTGEVCRHAFMAYGWRIMRDDVTGVYLRERMGIANMLMNNPTRWAVLFRENGKRETLVELHGYTFGFGPLPKMRLRKVFGILRKQIESAIPVEDEPPPDSGRKRKRSGEIEDA